MAKVQIKSEKLTPFGVFFQSWSNLTPCFHPLSTRHWVGDAAVSSDTNSAKLNVVESYDVDFDHQFLETEKYDAKPTYKKFLGYRPGVYVIGDKIAYIENSDGNTNVRFHQADTHKRFFSLLKSNNIRVNRFAYFYFPNVSLTILIYIKYAFPYLTQILTFASATKCQLSESASSHFRFPYIIAHGRIMELLQKRYRGGIEQV